MANHGFVSCKKKPTIPLIGEVIRNLNNTRFKQQLDIEEDGGCFQVTPKFDEYAGAVTVWLASPKKIEIRHGHWRQFMWWVDASIINELALRFNGLISDEGVSEKWQGEPNKYETYLSWLRLITAHITHPVNLLYVIQHYLDELPDVLLTDEEIGMRDNGRVELTCLDADGNIVL